MCSNLKTDLQRPPPPPAHTTKLWVNRFIYDSTYNVGKLRDDLMSYISKTVVAVVDVNSTNLVNNDLIGLVGLHGIDSTSQQQPATVTVDDVTIMSPDVEYHVIDVEYVEEFEKVFGRAMLLLSADLLSIAGRLRAMKQSRMFRAAFRSRFSQTCFDLWWKNHTIASPGLSRQCPFFAQL
jgi:hypothetical protein